MVTMITIFVVVYLIIFVVYAIMYSSTMQDLNKGYRVLKIEGVDTEKIKSRIGKRENNVLKLKKEFIEKTIANCEKKNQPKKEI